MAMGQLIRVVQTKMPGLSAQQIGSDLLEFSRATGAARGVLAVCAQLRADRITLRVKLAAEVADGCRADLLVLLRTVRALNDNCRIDVEPASAGTGSDIWSELSMRATPMSMQREATLMAELDKLTQLARALQAELPDHQRAPDLSKIYEPMRDVLEPVHPLAQTSADVAEWARVSVDFLMGGATLALALSDDNLSVMDYALAALAAAGWDRQVTLGRLMVPAVNARGVLEIASKAPGIVVVPASRVSLGSNVYELGSETRSLLSVLASSGRAAIFHGSLAELQAAFGGGQGGGGDPLRPVLRNVPSVAFQELVRFAVAAAGRRHGGIPPAIEEQLAADAHQALDAAQPAERERLLPLVAGRLVRAWSRGGKPSVDALAGYVGNLRAARETLGGICSRPRARRGEEVQERFARVLASPALLDRFREQLVGQDDPLTEFVARLRAECLTRPLHQPLRLCLEGPPASGKSSSVALLADLLDIPLVNIDAASMNDSYTASAQLLGSGRGIVGSHQAGRLEVVARHHRGAVVEVSDLDHAVPSVRSALADLFLQVLETGEAQSATGTMFGCCNLLFAFTMNLPGNRDQELRKHLGFVTRPTPDDIRSDVASEIRHLLSAAFLSRVGSPILFEPLSSRALAAILERAMVSAVRTASERMHLNVADVVCADQVGDAVLSARELDASCSGARGLLELGRSLATEALLALLRHTPDLSGRVVRVTCGPACTLALEASSDPHISDPHISDPHISDPHISDPHISDPRISGLSRSNHS